MAQFTLTWINTQIVSNDNAIGQRVSYRPKTTGGSWATTGFNPINDLAKSVNTTDTPDTLEDNIVYEFRIETLCTLNSGTVNDNGIQEEISFGCITPDLEQTYQDATITLDVTGLDITKARFSLRKASDNSLLQTIVVNRSGDSITYNRTGIASSTNFYWEVEMYANVDSIQVISSGLKYLGKACSPYPFTTDDPPVCDPLTSVDVTSIEIP